jgi:phage gpG-like protein
MPVRVIIPDIRHDPNWRRIWKPLHDLPKLSKQDVRKLADAVRRGLKLNFEAERSPDGEPWKELHPFTQWERSQGIDSRGVRFSTGARHPMLRRTGDLVGSLTQENHPRHRVDVRRSSIAGGQHTTIEVYAEDDPKTPGRIKLLHSGGNVKLNFRDSRTGKQHELDFDVPARPFIGLSEKALDLVDRTAIYVIDERLKRLVKEHHP